MNKIIVVGANGVGKSHFAARLGSARLDVPVISFDAIKLTTGWQQRPRAETDKAFAHHISRSAWILEGGPSLLFQAVNEADAMVWLDPPEYIRAWQLASRPWKFLGKTRPELPAGNVDWPLQQYRFAFRSLKKRTRFRAYIAEVYENTKGIQKWRCQSETHRREVIKVWAESTPA